MAPEDVPYRYLTPLGIISGKSCARHRAGRETLAALARALAPGGSLEIVEFRRGYGLGRVFEAAARAFGRRCTFYRPEELARLLSALGLETRVDELDGLRYAVRARRPLPGGAAATAVERASG